MLRPALLLLAAAFTAAAADKATAIDALISKYHEYGLFNGSILVAGNGTVLLKRGYGMANMEWGIPNTPDTKFRLGSITKQFTAALILQLAEEGKLDLSAPLSRYLKDYPAATGDRITVHQLLNHTSGIPGYTELPEFGAMARTPATPEAFVKTFSSLDLLFRPGTKYSYSNSGYFLAGYLIEKLTGKSYEAVLRDRILQPAGMNDSGYDLPAPLLSKRASGYDSTLDSGYRNAPYLDMTLPYAAGSLYSTVEDLYKWDQALYADHLLKPASKEKMFTPGLSNYGYGFVIRKQNGATVIEHGGGINGFNTAIVREIESRSLVVLLNNTGGAPLPEMATKIREILRGETPAMPKPPAAPVLWKTYQSQGMAAVLQQIAASDSPYNLGEGQLSRLAGHLLSKGKIQDALTLATLIMEKNPKSDSAAMLLARAHQAAGNRVEALQAWGRALELSETPRAFPTITDQIRRLSGARPAK